MNYSTVGGSHIPSLLISFSKKFVEIPYRYTADAMVGGWCGGRRACPIPPLTQLTLPTVVRVMTNTE